MFLPPLPPLESWLLKPFLVANSLLLIVLMGISEIFSDGPRRKSQLKLLYPVIFSCIILFIYAIYTQFVV